MAEQKFEANYTFKFNSVPTQNLFSPNQLRIENWNKIINQLSAQGNNLSWYLSKLDKFLFGTKFETVYPQETKEGFLQYLALKVHINEDDIKKFKISIQDINKLLGDNPKGKFESVTERFTDVEKQVASNTKSVSKITTDMLNLNNRIDNISFVFVGTEAQYDIANAKGEVPNNTLIVIIEDEVSKLSPPMIYVDEMEKYIKGDAVANATSYELYKKVGSDYTMLASNTEINFPLNDSYFDPGTYILVVIAKADGYEDSNYSNEITYVVNNTPEVDENTVDLVLFSGQSNMSGRGVAEDAPVVPSGSGYWYKNTSMSTMSQATEGLYDIVEPFGNESSSTGSLVSAFALEYYEQTGCPIVAVSCSTGGTSITQFQQDSRGDLMVDYINSAKNYLTSIGKTIRYTFLVWNQGENDAADNMSTEDYETNFMSMWNYVKTSGLERCFIINLGQHKLGTYDVTAIKLAQSNLAEDNDDIILASDKFTNSTEYMKDGWHYTQLVYNCVGKDTAKNIAYYYNTGERPTLSQFDASDAAGGEINIYGSLEEWEYTLDGTKVRLNAYTGEDSNVTVHRYYQLDGSMYESLVEDLHSGVSVPTFQDDTTIVYVEFEDGVTVEHNFGGSLFSGATSLRRVVNLPDVSSTSGIPKMFYGCSSLEEMPTFDHLIYSMANAFEGCLNLTGHIEIPNGATNLSGAFRSCSNITSVGDIPDTCTNLQNTFRDCTSLTSVGKVGGTATSMNAFYNCSSLKTIGTITNTFLTNINTAFYNCPLEGILRIEAEGISSCANAFLNVDLTKLIIQVPKGSTTYDTIVTAYPNATIQSLEGEALNGEGVVKTLESISVSYTGGDVAVGTDVNNLEDITVTAIYSDGTSETVTDYTLSGEINEGTNTVTVSYEGKTTTFTVNGIVSTVEYTLTISASPSDATIKINNVEQSSITVVEGTSVSWEVSKEGYITQSGNKIVSSNETLSITLIAEGVYGDLTDWTYAIDGSNVHLQAYNGTDPNVTVYSKYELDGTIYDTVIEELRTDVSEPCFKNNTVIETVEFEDGVMFDLNYGAEMFYGCTALKSIINIPSTKAGAKHMCYGCTALETYPTLSDDTTNMQSAFENCTSLTGHVEIPSSATNLQNAFRKSGITSVGDIPSTCSNLQYIFRDCTNLVSAGDVYGTAKSASSAFYGCTSLKSIGAIKNTSLTNISYMFYNCPLEGVLRIEAEGITTVTSAFLNVDLSKITIEVPVNSTTYSTLIAAYPDANITTF